MLRFPGSVRHRVHGCAFAAFVLAWLACLPIAFAQQAPDPKAKPRGLQKSPPFEPEKLKASIEKELQAARERLRRNALKPPADITPQESDSARKARAMLVHVLASQLESLDQISEHEKARAAAEKAERDWTGFPHPPPYSNLLADDVREQAATRRAAVGLLRSSRDAMELETERFRDRARDADEEVRRAAEAVEGAPGASSVPTAAANWRLEDARDRARLANALAATANIAFRELDVRVAIAQAELRLAERQLAALAGNFRISRADVEGAESRLDATRAQWDRDLQVALAYAARWAEERERAAAALQSARADVPLGRDSSGHAYTLRLAEARARAADAWSNSVAQQVRILTSLMTIYHDRIVDAWHWRYAVLSQPDSDSRRRARGQLDELVEFLRGWDGRSSIQQNEVRAAIQEQDKRMLSETDPSILEHERNAMSALRALDLAFERQQAVLERRLGRLEYWREDFAETLRDRPMTEVAADLSVRAFALIRDIWDYELLTIEDKVEVAGQTLTTSRGVTVGKSIGALLLFLVALRLMTFLSLRTERMMVRRFAVSHEKAKMMRRWVNAFAIILVLMITLNLARIPLTVFAFAGGALAIGIGFGMQTLIKNLISGVIVLFERHVRVGDVVEVDGVTGKVTAVDIRSSTIRGADGVENLIPNAALLEQKVTNWTLTNTDLRRVIRISVAYGSPVRAVADILEECATRHGMILKEPAPSVIFEDFGANALVFALYFWISLSPGTNPDQIMSDLRFMIDKRMREAGILIAVPQREIHFDATRPIRVEVASESERAAREGPHRIQSGFA
jgi:small-conductance mechanosensitive channel